MDAKDRELCGLFSQLTGEEQLKVVRLARAMVAMDAGQKADFKELMARTVMTKAENEVTRADASFMSDAAEAILQGVSVETLFNYWRIFLATA